jgi:hypothetical protein
MKFNCFVNGSVKEMVEGNSAVGVLRCKYSEFAKSRIFLENDADEALLGNDYKIAVEERLSAKQRGRGGSPKRKSVGDSGKSSTKTETVDALVEELRMVDQQLQAPEIARIPYMVTAANRISLLSGSNCDAVIAAMPRPMLLRMSMSLDGTNGDHKVDLVSRLIFEAETLVFRDTDRYTRSLKDGMNITARLLLTAAYGSERGDIQWSLVRVAVDAAKSRIDIQEGAAQAYAAAVP